MMTNANAIAPASRFAVDEDRSDRRPPLPREHPDRMLPTCPGIGWPRVLVHHAPATAPPAVRRMPAVTRLPRLRQSRYNPTALPAPPRGRSDREFGYSAKHVNGWLVRFVAPVWCGPSTPLPEARRAVTE